jgi:hypothetical protein
MFAVKTGSGSVGKGGARLGPGELGACGQLIEGPQLARRMGGAGESATVDELT